MQKEERTMEQIENEIELSLNSLRTAMTPLGELTDAMKQMVYESAVRNCIQELQGSLYDLQELRYPMIVTTYEDKDDDSE